MIRPPKDAIDAATDAYNKYKVLPSIQLGQFVLESSWGARCTGKFNFFGIKEIPNHTFTTCWTHEIVNGKTIAIQQKFADFNSIQEAFEYHSELLSNIYGPYAKAVPYLANMEQFINTIGPIYATDKLYATKLINLIRIEDLQQYDNNVI